VGRIAVGVYAPESDAADDLAKQGEIARTPP